MSRKLHDTTRNIYLANCLYDCIEDNNLRAVKKLLQENGANPNIIIPDRGITPFHLAIGSGDEKLAEEITKLFIGYGGNPNVRSVENLTPVHIAAAWGRLNVLNILLKCGGDPTLKDEEDKTPRDYAKVENYSNIVEFLENFVHDTNYETHLENLKYDITLNKIIINNGSLIAEYETTDTDNDLSRKSFDLNKLPKNVTNSYVNHWCLRHAGIYKNENISMNDNKHLENILSKTVDKHLNITNSDDNNLEKSITYISSEESVPKYYSRESGILTIHDSESENDLNKCILGDNVQSSTAEYMTCESLEKDIESSVNSLDKNIIESSVNPFDKNFNESLITLDLSEKKDEIWNISSDKSIISKSNVPCQLTAVNETEYVVNIEEEYKYTDNEEGIVLIEKRLLVNNKTDDNKSIISSSSKISTVPSVINYDTDSLRKELTCLGEPPGPITKTTKRVYLRKLMKLQKYTLLEPPVQKKDNRNYSVELEKTLRDPNWTGDLTSYKALESVIVNQFSKPDPSKRWREGCTKASFTYLLLDPRITLNLPIKSTDLSEEEIWKTFLSAIFYVGKGKRSRPYSHLYEAVNYWKKGQQSHGDNKKINYILDIWHNNHGVVCLHIFQNVIPVEAFTREAAMINALKLQNLCNSKLGDFYGICATWPERKKRLLGVYLLYRAMLIFLNEGERQLMPDDIGK